MLYELYANFIAHIDTASVTKGEHTFNVSLKSLIPAADVLY